MLCKCCFPCQQLRTPCDGRHERPATIRILHRSGPEVDKKPRAEGDGPPKWLLHEIASADTRLVPPKSESLAGSPCQKNKKETQVHDVSTRMQGASRTTTNGHATSRHCRAHLAIASQQRLLRHDNASKPRLIAGLKTTIPSRALSKKSSAEGWGRRGWGDRICKRAWVISSSPPTTLNPKPSRHCQG